MTKISNLPLVSNLDNNLVFPVVDVTDSNITKQVTLTQLSTKFQSTGPQGSGGTGPQGPQGVSGPQGYIGSTGPQGPIGPQGVSGPQGVKGSQGPQGIMGLSGPSGPLGVSGPQGVKGPQGPQGVQGPSGPALTISRTNTPTFGSTSLASQSTTAFQIYSPTQVFKSYALLKVSTNVAARVRLYTTAAARLADISRSQSIDPTAGSGIIVEVITTSGHLSQVISPAVIGFNDDSPPTNTIYGNLTNLTSATTQVNVTLTILKLEE
jgi:hypothetical protein